jgi:hypothetical protein
VHDLHPVLHHALEQAHVLGLVSGKAASYVRLPRMMRTTVQPFTPAQARTLLQVIKGNRLEAAPCLDITTAGCG